MKKKLTIIILILCSLGTYSQEIGIEKNDFTKILKFIEEKGDPLLVDGQIIYKIYSFVDSHGNNHVVRMGINRSIIMIDSYYKGIRNQKNFFDWSIKESSIDPFPSENTQEMIKIKEMVFAYEELLQKANQN